MSQETRECSSCGAEMTLETQKSGEKLSSMDNKIKPFYSTRCHKCSSKQPEKVQELIEAGKK